MSRKNVKLFVAIETNPKNTNKLSRASKTIRAIVRQGTYDAQPVSVISPDQVSLPANFSSTWAEQFVRSGIEAVSKTTKKLNIPFRNPPRVLPQTYRSRKVSAQTITEFAQEEKAGMLVLITHLKSRYGFLPFGGFAEATMSLSKVPVLTVNAKARPLEKIRTILFATDYSVECKQGFLKTLKIAKTLGAKVRLFHVLPRAVGPFTVAGSPMWMSSFEIVAFLDKEEARIRKIAESWAKQAKSEGVAVEIVFDKGTSGTAERILRASHGVGKNRADMIALTPKIAQLGAFLFGSTSREILRKSKVPVLHIHGELEPTQAKRSMDGKKKRTRIENLMTTNLITVAS